MTKILNWNVAAYLRLSKEDNENMESNSIINQRELMLLKNVDRVIITQDGEVQVIMK